MAHGRCAREGQVLNTGHKHWIGPRTGGTDARSRSMSLCFGGSKTRIDEESARDKGIQGTLALANRRARMREKRNDERAANSDTHCVAKHVVDPEQCDTAKAHAC